MLDMGCIANILSQNHFYKNKDLGYISSWLFNALDHNQIHIEFHSGLPVFFFSWAYLSESVVARYLYYNYTLDWSEWYEGELLWIIDLCSIIPFTQEDIINTLCSCFPEKNIFTGIPCLVMSTEFIDLILEIEKYHSKTEMNLLRH
ncbi:hypothetical protein AH97_15105 [Salmonella enterica subsp. enterica]|nr:hypothetical protein [Salmonella enterica subsp. enterica serovar Hartford]